MDFNKSIYDELNHSPHWYALHTRARHEKKVDQRLREKGITSYLPLKTFYRRWSDRHKKVLEPLFSCYVFVYLALRDRLPALQTQSVQNLVSFNGKPARIPEEQIDAIKQVLERKQNLESADYFTLGERVKVVQGPLKGLHGTFVKNKNKRRLVIEIYGIKQAISVEIDSRDLALG